MKKILCLISVFAFFVIVLTTISLNRDQEYPAAVIVEKTVKQISLYHYFSGSLSGGLHEMIDSINNSQKDVEIVGHALDHEAFKSMIHTTLAKGNPPEFFTYWAGGRVQELVDQKKIEPIDDLWNQAGLNDYFPGSIVDAACTYNGHKYLLPITQYVVVVYYNKRIFAEESLSPPQTWVDFINLCSHLKGKGIVPIALGSKERWPAQFWFDYLLLRTAGPKYRQELMSNQASYADSQVKNVYQLWSSMLLDGYFNKNANELDWAQATEMVGQGQAAMTLMGSWATQVLHHDQLQLTAGVNYDFFSFPLVNPDVPKTNVGPVDGLVLSRGSDNFESAKKMLALFAEVEPQQRMSKGSGALSPILQIPTSFYSPANQKIVKEVESASFWAFNYDLATSPDVAEKGMDSFVELIEFPDQYHAILENLQTEVSALLANRDH